MREIRHTQRDLGELAGIQTRTQDTERRILRVAMEKLDQVQASLPELQARAHDSEEAGRQYQAALLDRGRLVVVASNARTALASA